VDELRVMKPLDHCSLQVQDYNINGFDECCTDELYSVSGNYNCLAEAGVCARVIALGNERNNETIMR